ncbi:hypothetical protein ACFSUJ_34745 [Streptomyces lusitanus]|uniref:hypothetical protein n=1 Tax=Streptomyces lusitanus TaxID=68232 RepID=UPI0036360F30
MEQLVAVELLAALEPLLDRRRAELRVQRDHLAGRLADDARWRFTVPEGGLVLWATAARCAGRHRHGPGGRRRAAPRTGPPSRWTAP